MNLSLLVLCIKLLWQLAKLDVHDCTRTILNKLTIRITRHSFHLTKINQGFIANGFVLKVESTFAAKTFVGEHV